MILVQGTVTDSDSGDVSGSGAALRRDSALGTGALQRFSALRRQQGHASVGEVGGLTLTATRQRIIYDDWVITAVVTNVSPR